MQYIALITMGVTALLLASMTPIVHSALGRLLLVATITSLVVCSPVVESPVIDRLIAAFIGGGALHYLVGMALGPVPYRLMTNPPRALIEMRRGAYRIDCAVAFA